MPQKYPLMATINIALLVFTLFVAWPMISSPTSVPWEIALGFLLPPFFFFCWVFTTVRGLHRTGNYFWLLASTWVLLVVDLIAASIALFTFLTIGHLNDTHQNLAGYTGATAYLTASILHGFTVGWCLYYNYRKSQSFLLALHVTVLQSVFIIGVITIINVLMGNRRDEAEA